jgi:hypothetical protein
LAVGHFHSGFLAFFQGFTAAAVDCAEMYEYILAAFLLDEAEAFFIVEPFYFAFYLC